ncbi:MAG: hypothetical protein C0498_10180 [Anaerolinea sp.]|nr:hypothetical protein [Anaerolinea sp.]
MASHRLQRAVGVASSTLLALTLIGPSAVQAAPPGWAFENQALLPATVSPGANAGYTFTIANRGKSNISQLYLTSSATTSPTYLATTRAGCQTTPVLYCAFGALNSGDVIDITVAYTTPTTGSTSSVTFQLNATGVTFSDKGGNSRGDTLNLLMTTALNGGKDFAGGFNLVGGSTFANNTDLGRRNIQSGAVTLPPGAINIPVELEDGPSIDFPCFGCANLFGEWTRLNVNDGATYDSGIKVVLTILGREVPNAASVDTIKLIHVSDSHGTHTISDRCDGDGLLGGDECITVTKVGNNYQIVAWLLSNGGTRFGY